MKDDSTFCCPTSGALFKWLVQALGLHLEGVGGRDAAKVLGSGNSGTTARRYYLGTSGVCDHTRRALCLSAVEAADHAGLLAGFELPRRQPDSRPVPKQFLADVLFEWLRNWDDVYVRAASAFGRLPRDRAGFAVGRPAALDLGARAGALIHLCGVETGDFVVLAPGETPVPSLLKYLTDPTVAKWPLEQFDRLFLGADAPRTSEPKPFDPNVLADGLGRAESTVARWSRENNLPSPESVDRLVEHFAPGDADRTRLRRWLRVQLALICVERQLAASLGRAFSRQLLAGFCEMAGVPSEMHPNQGMPRPQFLLGQLETLERGVAAPAARHALQLVSLTLPLQWPPTPLSEEWVEDFRAAQSGRVPQRLTESLGALAAGQ